MTAAEALALVQGTPEWRQARAGFVTASRVADATAAKSRGKGEAGCRADYRAEIISERLTNLPYPQHFSKVRALEWGRQNEAAARFAYESKTGELVDVVGFAVHPSIPWFGCSPDGLVGDDGMLQIKCPDTRTHLEWILAGIVPIEHAPQLLAELSCNQKRSWIDFLSFDPRLPEYLQKFIVRFPRNDKLISILETEIIHFNAEVDQVLAALPQGPQPIAEVLEWPQADEIQF